MSTDTDIPHSAAILQRDVSCQNCGYSLRGLVEHRCPECGTRFDPAMYIESHVPWVRRNGASALKAYIRTVAAFVTDPRKAAHELCRPGHIDFIAARAFRNITIAVAIGAVVAPFWIMAVHDAIFFGQTDGVLMVIAFTLVIGPSLLAFFVWMSLLPTEVADDWNLAVHCYAFSPMALTSFAAIVFLAGVFINSNMLLIASLIIVIGCCAAWWCISSVCLSVAARSRSPVLWSHLLVMFPLQWVVGMVLAGVIAVAVGGLIGGLFFMIA